MRLGAALTVVVSGVLSSAAHADETVVFAERWHELPTAQHLNLEEQLLVEHLTEFGNFIGNNVNTLSDDVLAMKFDGRRQRARIRLGTPENQHLRFDIDTRWRFTPDAARFATRIDLGVGSHDWHVTLPEMEMVTTSYHDQQGVIVRLPIFERTW